MNLILRLSCVFLFCFLQIFASAQDESAVLFSIEDKPVTVGEFKYIYEKNNGEMANYSAQGVNEYIDLYKNFKLKVTRAKEMQLDTLPALIKELGGYRKQLANSYLNDKEVTAALVEEVIQRMDTDKQVSHIFLPLDQKASKTQIAEVEKKANDIYKRIQNGEEYESVAKGVSQDKASAVSGGKLGYYVSPLPSGFYAFENAMYNTPVGQVAAPIRSKMGMHIIKVSGERPARGEMEISHILIRKTVDGVVNQAAKASIDSIYQALNLGTSNFEAIAKLKSQDKNTAQNGGYLGYIKINQYDVTFEDVAFGLTKDGEYSAPFESTLGWHIIKRVSKKDFSDKDKLRKSMKSRIAKDDRLELSKKAFIENIKKEAGVVVNFAALNTFKTKLTDEFYSYKWSCPEYPDTDIITFKDGTKYSITDFGTFCKKNTKERLKYTKDNPRDEIVESLFEMYVDDVVLHYEEANLEAKYPNFKALMREYEEGILLFEATKIEVWDKASSDSIGLQQFYSQNTKNYVWEERANIQTATIKTENAKAMKKINKALAKMDLTTLQTKYSSENVSIVVEEPSLVTADSDLAKDLEWKQGYMNQKTNADGSITVTKVNELLPAGEKSFNEAKGYIIADYQDQLEKEWIKSLKAKYKIVENQDVISQLIK